MGSVKMKARQPRLDMAARLGRDVPIQEVADAIHISRAALSNIERGKSWPTHGVLARLCDFYHLTPCDLIEYTPGTY